MTVRTCAVCESAYTSRTHRDRCMREVSLEVCACPPGPHLGWCVEVLQSVAPGGVSPAAGIVCPRTIGVGSSEAGATA